MVHHARISIQVEHTYLHQTAVSGGRYGSHFADRSQWCHLSLLTVNDSC
jgi:hypothetical protein